MIEIIRKLFRKRSILETANLNSRVDIEGLKDKLIARGKNILEVANFRRMK